MTRNGVEKADKRLQTLAEKVIPVYHKRTKYYRIPKIRSFVLLTSTANIFVNGLRNLFKGCEKVIFSPKAYSVITVIQGKS